MSHDKNRIFLFSFLLSVYLFFHDFFFFLKRILSGNSKKKVYFQRMLSFFLTGFQKIKYLVTPKTTRKFSHLNFQTDTLFYSSKTRVDPLFIPHSIQRKNVSTRFFFLFILFVSSHFNRMNWPSLNFLFFEINHFYR